MTDSLKSLYPDCAAEIQTVLRLGIPRVPDAPVSEPNLGSPRDFYGKRMLEELLVDDKDRVAFIDKAFPHSRYDVMTLASDERIRSAIVDLAPATRGLLAEVAARFVEYVSEPDVLDEHGLSGGHFHMSFNYDPATADRENSMFYDKRFHMHMNYWPGRDLTEMTTTRWGDIPSTALRRRLIDPLSFVAASIMYEALDGRAAGYPLLPVDVRRDVQEGLPPGLKLRLPGWHVLREPGFIAALEALHRCAARTYDALYSAFTGEAHEPRLWQRPRLLPPPEIAARLSDLPWLSTRGRRDALRIGSLLRDVTPEECAVFRDDAETRIRCMTLGGLDYSISLFSWCENSKATPLKHADEVFLVMQCKLFADIGGAGLPSMRRIALVRLDREAGRVMQAAEYEDRLAFRSRFIAQVLPELAARFRAYPVNGPGGQRRESAAVNAAAEGGT